jgi:hypothetical protein
MKKADGSQTLVAAGVKLTAISADRTYTNEQRDQMMTESQAAVAEVNFSDE